MSALFTGICLIFCACGLIFFVIAGSDNDRD